MNLLSVGHLQRIGVVARPSLTIKSPYVASVVNPSVWAPSADPFRHLADMEGSDKEKKKLASEIAHALAQKHELQLAHAPSLDCAGMLIQGKAAWVTENRTETKTALTVQLCEEERGDEENVLVGYHPALAEKLAKSMLEKGLVSELGKIENIASQRTFGNSRVDFILETENNTLTLVEVKNVVGAEYGEGSVPCGRSSVGVYTVPTKELPSGAGSRHAIFPHGSLKPGIGVVSDRAIKHVTELGQLEGTVDPVSGRTIRTAVLFVVNRSDTAAFRPAHEACPVFAQSLKRAKSLGTKLIAKEIQWKLGTDDKEETIAYLGKDLPCVFHSSVTEDIDEEHLQRILQYNKDVPKTRSPPSKKRKAESD